MVVRRFRSLLSRRFLAGLSLFVGSGVAIGFVLHWLLPAIDFGLSVLFGVVALAFTCQAVTRLMSVSLEVEDEEAIEPRNVVYLVEGMSGRGKRKRKGKR